MIYTPIEVHRVASPTEYRALVERAMADRRKAGFVDAHVWENAEPRVAYISASNWVIDCPCRAGNMVHPDWPIAGCLACGAIHRTIVFPPDRDQIEAALNARPHDFTRHWHPQHGDTLATLRAENDARGLTKGTR